MEEGKKGVLFVGLILAAASFSPGQTRPGRAEVTAKADLRESGKIISGEWRFDLGGGPLIGRVDLDLELDASTAPRLSSGDPALGRLVVALEFDGSYKGGLYGSAKGTVNLAGRFVAMSGDEATVKGQGIFSGSLSAPLGQAEAVCQFEPLEFQGGGLQTPQPLLLPDLPCFVFPEIDALPEGAGLPPDKPADKAPLKAEAKVQPVPPKETPPTKAGPDPEKKPAAPPAAPSTPASSSTPVPAGPPIPPVSSTLATTPASSAGGSGGFVIPRPESSPLLPALIALVLLCAALGVAIVAVARRRQSARRPSPKTLPIFPATAEVVRGQVLQARLDLAADTTIGRDPANVLVVDDPEASRFHARVEFKGNEWILRDLGSSNGTYLNGVRVSSQTLKDGDIVQIGEQTVYFHLKR
ncbi:MAG: FHA domain-containing protein [Candidatus Aminicenantes bacterium]|nr:FHA domain-containing protein [Candidatus Aminicenantes bacterium]